MFKWFLIWLVSAVAYYLAGLFGLELAIPPGFASAVWPASGVALALGILTQIRPVILGTLTASFALNFQLASSGFTQLSWQGAISPLTIAMGAAIQVALGYWLFKRLQNLKGQIDTPHAIIRFALIVAPGSCLVAASFGSAGLYFNHIINDELVLFTWFTWWLGDTIGVLLFTPMLLVLFYRRETIPWIRRLQIVIPSFLIFITTWGVFIWSLHSRQASIDDELHDTVDRYTQKLNERLILSSTKLLAFQAYFQGSEYISYAEFFAFSQILLDRDSALHAVGWTQVTPHNLRNQQEARIRSQGYPTFQFTEPSPNGMVRAENKIEYYPILYIYPYEKNKQALGLDLSSLPGRLDILKLIQLDGKGRATKPITLVQETEQQRASILYLPVWKSVGNKRSLEGYVSGVYRINGILGSIISDLADSNIDIEITDITNPNTPYALISSSTNKNHFIETIVREVSFFDRVYKVEYLPFDEYMSTKDDWISWIILVAGFLISALLQVFILMMTGTIEYTSLMVSKRTEQLTIAMENAEQASRAKSSFLANMSHELRTPLNAIIGLINLCLKTNLNPQQTQYLDQSKLATQTLMALINQSLDYAKIESGKLELESTQFELADIVRKLNAIFSVTSSNKAVEFKIESNSLLPKYIIGDELRIEQVLLNLCGNALKFTQQGQVTVTFNLESTDETRHHFIISVRDTGIGITQEQQDHLFESFRQADNSTTRKFGGTGLGLAISKQLIELMGGTIELKSEAGKGSEFVINVSFVKGNDATQLPLAEMLAQEGGSNNASRVLPENGLSNTTILLVEDIEINRLVATELLEEHGACVLQANNGQHALDVLASEADIDLVLMDIQMPVMDGYEATQCIRQLAHLKTLPILAMTANAMNEDIEKCYSVGMNGHIAKPIDEYDMISTILSQLSAHPPNSEI